MESLQQVFIRKNADGDFQFNPSFGPYVNFLKARMENARGLRSQFYSYIVKKFEKFPELLVPFEHEELNAEHDELLSMVQMSLIPLASVSEDSPIALAFMQPETFFYYTDSFRKLLEEEKIDFNTSKDHFTLLKYFQKHILERYYKLSPDNIQHFFKKVHNPEKNTTRHFKIMVDSRFTQVHVIGDLPDYKPEWHELLYLGEKDYFASLGQFPFASFNVEGFLLVEAIDVSEQAAIKQLNNAVANMHSLTMQQTLTQVQESMAELLHDAQIKTSIIPFFNVNGEIVYDDTFLYKPLLVNTTGTDQENRINKKDIYELFGKSVRPFIYSKADAHLRKQQHFLKGLEQQQINSYMAFPIRTREGLLGIFELGSGDPGVITEATIEDIQLAFPIITDVVYFMIQSFNSRIERTVKEKFTSLQPSVEWKFNKAAWEFIKLSAVDKNVQISNIVFKQVNPLYGAVDIKDSSVQRNSSCTLDYQTHLGAVLNLLRETATIVTLPLLEGLEYKSQNFLKKISTELLTEEELKINDFLHNELEPVLHFLTERHPDIAERVNQYFADTEMSKGLFHHNRRSYETSVNLLNENLDIFFETEVKQLQSVYPFYFEKYRTDGLEYNIYIGPSIVPDQPYNAIHLKNLRVWQITSMAKAARLNFKLKETLPLQLETTQIILVYGHTIDISFRKDERRFDVEGSYNARYEVIKKRIDKVRLKDSTERLTKPGCIAIVFNNQKDIEEYKEQIEFIQNKGLLTNQIETLDLEELQGVSGLRALRLAICYDNI